MEDEPMDIFAFLASIIILIFYLAARGLPYVFLFWIIILSYAAITS